tara:strand:+ start:2137 stop:2523 length:387 start_codon:yes stop_codon:yes gene_type:complete
MAFLKRLGFYLIGLSIGIVFLAIFFKKKSEETGVMFCYFPNCRTLKDIRSKTISYSDAVNNLLKNKAVDSADIANVLLNGEVDFGNSDTKSPICKTYIIEGGIRSREVVVKVKNCETTALIEEISFSN